MIQIQRIGTRIGIGFGLLIAATVASFSAAVWVGVRGQQSIQIASDELVQRTSVVQNMQIAQLEAISSIRNAGLMTNSRTVKTELVVFNEAYSRLQKEESEFLKLPLDPQSQALIEKSIQLRKQAEPVIAEAKEFVQNLSGEESAKVLSIKLTPIQTEWSNQLRALSAHEKEIAESKVAQITQANTQKIGVLALVLVGVSLGGIAFAVRFARSITTPLKGAVAVAQKVAAGELDVQIHPQGGDEVSVLLQALKTMVEQLSSMVSSVRESTSSISNASEEISSGNLDLSARTEHQAATLEQTSAALSELTEAVNDSTSHTASALGLAEQTAATANRAGDTMGQVVATMSLISESSKRIADIIGVIEGIAFQTNILALNAAVEAARAGDQGRGFAVVASEVRALAQRVTGAANEVRTLITESVARVDDGSSQVTNMGGTMQELVNSANQAKSILHEIAVASSSQNERIAQISDAVKNIDGSTQQNAALVEEVAAAAQSLVSQTHSLNALVGRFHLDSDTELQSARLHSPVALIAP